MARWLARLLGYVPAEEREGVSLSSGPHWQVAAPGDFAVFFRALAALLPEDSVVYLEGTSLADEVRSFLEPRLPASTTKVAIGTIWPRPRIYHMSATRENLEELAQLADRYPAPEVADHVHAYKGDTVLLQWHDAPDNEICISSAVAEDRVRQFAAVLGTSHESFSADD